MEADVLKKAISMPKKARIKVALCHGVTRNVITIETEAPFDTTYAERHSFLSKMFADYTVMTLGEPDEFDLVPELTPIWWHMDDRGNGMPHSRLVCGPVILAMVTQDEGDKRWYATVAHSRYGHSVIRDGLIESGGGMQFSTKTLAIDWCERILNGELDESEVKDPNEFLPQPVLPPCHGGWVRDPECAICEHQGSCRLVQCGIEEDDI